jgi:Zn finger protein HypA/HybF involved in hydrogenase expression
MRTKVGPIERLTDAAMERRSLWALCKACGHAVRLDPRNLIALAGDVTLRQVQTRFRCRKCGKRRATVVVGDEGWPGRD